MVNEFMEMGAGSGMILTLCMDTIAIIVRKSELMKHKRDDHVETVKKCENYKDGTCRYSCV